jgi:hypothetical protein
METNVSLAVMAVCDFEPEPPGPAHCNNTAPATVGRAGYRMFLRGMGWRYDETTGKDYCPEHAKEKP